jgi:tRNA(Ile)-lysidine synthase
MNDQLMPSKDLLDELLRQVLNAKKDAELKIELSKEFEIRRYKDEIYLVYKNQQTHKNYEIIWKGESEILLPNGSELKFTKVKGKGISFVKIKDKKLMISNRKGGESIKLNANRPTKKLKRLFQESNMPPWIRHELPFVYCDKELIMVPSLGISSEFQVNSDEIGLKIQWNH